MTDFWNDLEHALATGQDEYFLGSVALTGERRRPANAVAEFDHSYPAGTFASVDQRSTSVCPDTGPSQVTPA